MGTPVRITLGTPRWRPPGRRYWLYLAELAPQRDYFNAPAEEFERRYLAQLDELGDAIEQKLGWLTEAYGPILLCCYEKDVRDPLACHRRMFARWYEARTGQPVPEIG
jgi:hypothetical protein